MARRQKLSLETRRKISSAQQGRKNSFYGRHHSAATRRKIGSLTRGKRNPMFGRHHSPQAKLKIGIAARKRFALRKR